MRVRLSKTAIAGLVAAAALAAGAGAWAAGAFDGAEAAERPVRAEIDGWRWAPRDAEPPPVRPEPEPERAPREEPAEPAPQAEEPPDPPEAPVEPEEIPPLPDADDDALGKAQVLGNGIALPPLEAPTAVKAIFEAGNTIARSPYKWGGGHGKWQDNGYDCSGSVSYALAAAGLLDAPLASGPLMAWGKPGRGRWITIYSNPGHVFMEVAGVRFDTIARGQTGSRWIESEVSTKGYVARHPQGL